mmetsp:Transcript_35831/g.43273  ORF Transcript_35831/g.43273 Transcript_35831/m.43273 type:complete len:567 (-) Transcript_35831:245-1945(-)
MFPKATTLLLSALYACSYLGDSDAAPASDAVDSLPMFGVPPTPQYSGFLDASAAEEGTHLHYWYAETSAPNPAEAPVVLWLNGGPGSSSILGMLQEQGPLLINSTGGLMENPYAWTTLVNLLVLESPAGVGYSYCKASLSGGSCSNTDNSTAAAARAALQDFFENKFPELKPNPFFITGESYAGVYVPTLSREVLDHAPEINFHGVAVGDPCTDNESQAESMDMLWYAHKAGFVPDDEYEFLWNKCRVRHPSYISQGAWGAAAEDLKATAELSDVGTGLDPSKCKIADRKFLMSSSRALSQTWKHAWINDLTLYGASAVVDFNAPGSLNYLTAQYMMRPDVRQALHVASAPAKVWPGPDAGWGYTSQYAACNPNALPGTPSMVDIYRYIAPRLMKTLVYNGDTDPCVSYEGTRAAIKKVGFNITEGGAYRPWFFNATASSLSFFEQKPVLYGPALDLKSAGPQFGGHVVDYEHNLSFITVHGSGHMVPQFRPRPALHMLAKVLSQEEFSPPWASDDVILGMDDDQYDSYLNDWTLTAQAAPYVPAPSSTERPKKSHSIHANKIRIE